MENLIFARFNFLFFLMVLSFFLPIIKSDGLLFPGTQEVFAYLSRSISFNIVTLRYKGLAMLMMLIFNQNVLFAQQTPAPFIINHTQQFVFDANARQGSSLIVNDLLQMIADGTGKLRVFTQFSFSSRVEVSFAMGGNNLLVYPKVHDIIFTGDTRYRYFSIQKYLTPSLIDLVVRINSSDGRLISEIPVKNFAWENSTGAPAISIVLPNNGRGRENYSVSVAGVNFGYDEEFLTSIKNLNQTFAAYYRAPGQIEKAFGLVDGLDPENFERAILDEFRLCEAEALAGELNAQPFISLISPDGPDPENVITRLSILNDHLGELRKGFNHTLVFIDSLYYQHGLRLLQLRDTLKARESFSRAIVYNPLHIPAHISLATIDLYSGKPADVMERMASLLGPAAIPGKWSPKLYNFISEMFHYESNRAADAMADGRFFDALRILSRVEALCRDAARWDCPQELFDKTRDVHYGMFRSYLSVARRAYVSGNFSFAVQYINSALDYRDANKTYITNDREAMELLQMVVDGYYVAAEKAWERNDFSAASSQLETALELCRKHPVLQCSGDADALAQRARQRSREAERITVPVVISEPQVIQSPMTRPEAIALVRDLLSKGHLKAWAGETAESRQFLNQLLPVAIRFDLRRDDEINARIVSLSSQIAEKECESKLQDLNITLNVVNDYFTRAFYADARRSLNMARDIQQSANQCSWNLADSLLKYDYVYKAADYQTLIFEAQNTYFRAGQRGFENFLSQYDAATRFYTQQSLSSFGVKHESLFEFTASSANSGLMRAVITWYSDRGEPELAVHLLKLLKEQGFGPRELKNLMEYAGSRAALTVSKRQTGLRPQVWLTENTHDDKWFREFNKSFIKSWPR